MLSGSLLLFFAVFAVFMAWNALRAPHNERRAMRRPPWLFVLLTAEIVPIHLAGLGTLTILAWATGGLSSAQGKIGIVLLVPAIVMYVLITIQALGAHAEMRQVLEGHGIEIPRIQLRIGELLLGWPFRVPGDIERIEDIIYAPKGQLDLYRLPGLQGRAPALLQIHGGEWSGGNRRQQARPLINELTRRGWICISVSYPLVPEATFPDQLVALKQALAWMKTHGTDLGIDPDRIAVTGGSAGGHLAALLALTYNDPRYQPGFASVDTSVAAAVPIYGIFDLLNRQRTRDDFEVIPKGLMKSLPGEDEERYRAASPIDQVRRDAPPFLVVHGSVDSLVSPTESSLFVRALSRLAAAGASCRDPGSDALVRRHPFATHPARRERYCRFPRCDHGLPPREQTRVTWQGCRPR